MCFLVESLNVLVPKLLDKLKVVEEKKPVNNVTTNIMRIRELIAQARSVAKKVSSSLGTYNMGILGPKVQCYLLRLKRAPCDSLSRLA